jgi:hypothetical protein
VIVGDPRQRARELIAFCDGFDEGGLYPEFTRRARMVARDMLELADQVDAERSARRAAQDGYRRALAILERQAGDAALPDVFRRRAAAAVEAEQ